METRVAFQARRGLELEDDLVARDLSLQSLVEQITGVDLTEAIQAVDEEAQVAAATCVSAEGVGGLTHTNNNDKSTITGALLVEEAIPGLTFDVTIVGIKHKHIKVKTYTKRAN